MHERLHGTVLDKLQKAADDRAESIICREEVGRPCLSLLIFYVFHCILFFNYCPCFVSPKNKLSPTIHFLLPFCPPSNTAQAQCCCGRSLKTPHRSGKSVAGGRHAGVHSDTALQVCSASVREESSVTGLSPQGCRDGARGYT